MALTACGGPSAPAIRPEPALAASHSGASSESARQVTALADEYWKDLIQTFPLYGLFAGVPEAPNDRLNDNSIAATRAWERKEDGWLARLAKVDDLPQGSARRGYLWGAARDARGEPPESRLP